MANLMSEKLNKIYKLLSEHKFTIISDVNDDLKCVICKNILINANQAICECNFCYKCINEYINGGGEVCPGNTEECKLENLSNISTNHRVNKQISKLIVKCYKEMCSHECQLIDMEKHLGFCLKKSVKCPFYDFGCKYEKVVSDKLNEHFLLEIHNHNKILIDIIGNLRNEVAELKDKVEKINAEIEHLKKSDNRKDEKIELLNEEIKKENKELVQNMEIGHETNNKCINDISKLINEEITLIKIEKEKLTQQTKSLESNFNVKINAKLGEIKEEWREKVYHEMKNMKEENEKFVTKTKIRINQIDKFLNMRNDGTLWWRIGKINEIDKDLSSENFYDIQKPYKMELELTNEKDRLHIWLFIHYGTCDEDLKWPCQAKITVNIFSLNDEHKDLEIIKFNKINKPEIDSCEVSDPIICSHSDLERAGLMKTNCLLACAVEFR